MGASSKNRVPRLYVLLPRLQNIRITRHVFCGLPKLSIYSNMEERKRRGLHRIPKTSKTLTTCRVVSGVSASCAVVQTGWGVHKLLPGLRFLVLSTSLNLQSFTKRNTPLTHGTFVGVTEKAIRHKDVAALCWGLQQRIKRETRKWHGRGLWGVFLSKHKKFFCMAESVWDLRTSTLLKID